MSVTHRVAAPAWGMSHIHRRLSLSRLQVAAPRLSNLEFINWKCWRRPRRGFLVVFEPRVFQPPNAVTVHAARNGICKPKGWLPVFVSMFLWTGDSLCRTSTEPLWLRNLDSSTTLVVKPSS